MSEKQSEARRKFWASVPKEQRSLHARHAVLARHSKMTKEEKTALAKKLNLAIKMKKETKATMKACKNCGKKKCNC